MRTLRVPLVVAAILLLAGSVIGCTPSWQEDWDIETVYLPAAYVTGETKDTGSDENAVWEASDPRLSGTVSVQTEGLEFGGGGYGGAPPGAYVDARVYEVVTGDGRWVGTSTGLRVEHTDDVLPETVILRGEGAYDGLSAYLVLGSPDDADGDFPPFRGLIFPGEMPSFPE